MWLGNADKLFRGLFGSHASRLGITGFSCIEVKKMPKVLSESNIHGRKSKCVMYAQSN